jgi:two-component system response regulator YesN
MEFDTSFSKLIELELSQNSEKIIFMEGKYNPIIKSIVYSILNNINKGVLGDKIIQIKVDELFLFILPQLIEEKIQVIDNIRNYIKGNFDKKITISQLSKLFKVSEYYIREGIKNKSNSTFSEYLKLIRLEKAHELLKSNKNLSYNQIAKLIGYSNSSRLKNDIIEYLSELKEKNK